VSLLVQPPLLRWYRWTLGLWLSTVPATSFLINHQYIDRMPNRVVAPISVDLVLDQHTGELRQVLRQLDCSSGNSLQSFLHDLSRLTADHPHKGSVTRRIIIRIYCRFWSRTAPVSSRDSRVAGGPNFTASYPSENQMCRVSRYYSREELRIDSISVLPCVSRSRIERFDCGLHFSDNVVPRSVSLGNGSSSEI
jgi:hypothetical protein